MPATPILLADDSQDDQFLFKRLLRLSSFTNPVIAVPDGDEAIAYLKGEGRYADREKHPLPGIVILDLKMPKKSGFEVLQWIKSQPHFANLPVVVLAGTDHPEDLKRSFELGANSFLTKPCNAQDLKNLADGFKEQWTRTESS